MDMDGYGWIRMDTREAASCVSRLSYAENVSCVIVERVARGIE